MDYSLLFDKLLKLSLEGTFLVLIIYLIRKPMKKHMKKSYSYYIWLVLIIKLLLPFGIESSISIYNIIPKSLQSSNIEKSLNENFINKNNLIDLEDDEENSKVNNLKEDTFYLDNGDIVIEENSSLENRNNNIFTNIDMDLVKKSLATLWAIIAIAIVLKTIIKYIIFKNKIKKEKYRNNDSRLEEYLEEGKILLNINRNIKIKLSKLVKTPILIGQVGSFIVIPESLINTLEDEEIKYIILHELSHYKRKDIIIVWLSKLVEIIQFFNPIICFGLKTMREDCEESCDEYVLSKLDKNEIKAYGNTIIKVIQNISINHYLIGTTAMASNKKNIKERIKNIASNKSFSKKSKIIGLIIIAVIIILGITTAKSSTKLNIDTKNINYMNTVTLKVVANEKEIIEVEDREKIIEYLNSIKFGKEIEENYKGRELEIVIKGEEEYNIAFLGDTVKVNEKKYKVNSRYLNELKTICLDLQAKEYVDSYSVETENKPNENSDAYIEIQELISESGYEIVINGGMKITTKLPLSFDEERDGQNIGRIIENIHYESKDNKYKTGYELLDYLGKEVEFLTYVVKNENTEDSSFGAFVADNKVISYYFDDREKINETLRVLDSYVGYGTSGEKPIYINNVNLAKYAYLNDVIVDKISLQIVTKENIFYEAKLYKINAESEEILIYEFDDREALKYEMQLIDDSNKYNEKDYLIDINEIKNRGNIYLNDNIICLYNGSNKNILKFLQKFTSDEVIKIY